MKLDTREEKRTIKQDVELLIKRKPYLAKNSNQLFVAYCDMKGLETDPRYNVHAHSLMESIGRSRRKFLENNPEYRDKEVTDARDWERAAYQDVFCRES